MEYSFIAWSQAIESTRATDVSLAIFSAIPSAISAVPPPERPSPDDYRSIAHQYDIASVFRRLADQWYDEVGGISTSRGKFTHPAYRKILELGEDAVPFILKELLGDEGHWFQALRILTRENPAATATNYDEAVQAWLSWGHLRGKI